MSEEKTRGIILNATPYKETGALVSVYTHDFGKMTLVARGVKKLNSKNAGSVMPITYSELTIVPRQGLSTLIRGESLDHFKFIKETFTSQVVASYLCEYFHRYVADNQPDEQSYNFLYEALMALNQGYHYMLIYALINAWILKQNGILLDVDGCVFCGNTKVIGFSGQDGGFVCQQHRNSYTHIYPPYVLKAIRHLYKASLSDLDRLSTDGVKEAGALFEHYVDEYCGIQLKSKSFMKQIV
ncbi:MAG: DNA repair protein RecO [Erysipelotrichaceae bacterium]|nr:DNA repair protein RecO [Erysipelotrichaceae bacterium]